jgi:hypothetical protein
MPNAARPSATNRLEMSEATKSPPVEHHQPQAGRACVPEARSTNDTKKVEPVISSRSPGAPLTVDALEQLHAAHGRAVCKPFAENHAP